MYYDRRMCYVKGIDRCKSSREVSERVRRFHRRYAISTAWRTSLLQVYDVKGIDRCNKGLRNI